MYVFIIFFVDVICGGVFQGSKGEAAKINKYHTELKEQYALRISKIDGVENKPWRQEEKKYFCTIFIVWCL